MTGFHNPKSSGKKKKMGHFFSLHDCYRCIPRPWDFFIRYRSSFIFLQNQIWVGEVLSSEIVEISEQKWCAFIVARVFFLILWYSPGSPRRLKVWCTAGYKRVRIKGMMHFFGLAEMNAVQFVRGVCVWNQDKKSLCSTVSE